MTVATKQYRTTHKAYIPEWTVFGIVKDYTHSVGIYRVLFQKKLYRDFKLFPNNMKKSWKKSSCDRSDTDARCIQRHKTYAVVVNVTKIAGNEVRVYTKMVLNAKHGVFVTENYYKSGFIKELVKCFSMQISSRVTYKTKYMLILRHPSRNRK